MGRHPESNITSCSFISMEFAQATALNNQPPAWNRRTSFRLRWLKTMAPSPPNGSQHTSAAEDACTWGRGQMIIQRCRGWHCWFSAAAGSLMPVPAATAYYLGQSVLPVDSFGRWMPQLCSPSPWFEDGSPSWFTPFTRAAFYVGTGMFPVGRWWELMAFRGHAIRKKVKKLKEQKRTFVKVSLVCEGVLRYVEFIVPDMWQNLENFRIFK
jgi:hypothetical protein